MRREIFVLVAAGAGVCSALQSVLNAALAGRVGMAPALFANSVIVLAVCTAALVFSGHLGAIASFRTLPLWLFLGGVFGLGIIYGAPFALPRLGATTTLMLIVLGQAIAGLVIDRFGLFGVPARELGASRLVGVSLVVLGVVLVRR